MTELGSGESALSNRQTSTPSAVSEKKAKLTPRLSHDAPKGKFCPGRTFPILVLTFIFPPPEDEGCAVSPWGSTAFMTGKWRGLAIAGRRNLNLDERFLDPFDIGMNEVYAADGERELLSA
jgi:hypothetical protein